MEIFTGKNKIEFEKWYPEHMKESHGYNYTCDEADIEFFYCVAKSFQQGVYLEYLDSRNDKVIPDYNINKKMWFAWLIGDNNRVRLMSEGSGRNVLYFDTRQEALMEAFKKADELINSNN